MIIESKKKGIQIVPVLGEKLNGAKQITSNVTLFPGMNEVSDDIWNVIKDSLKDDIERSLLIPGEARKVKKEVEVEKEIEKKVEKPDPKDPDKTIEITEKVTVKEKEEKEVDESIPFKELKSEEAEKIVKDTWNLKTLKEWKKKEARESVRIVILEQIDHIKKYGEDKKKKIEEEDK
jgi:hypothetical protein